MNKMNGEKKELNRLKALKDYQILDTLPEDQYDNITRLASYICKTPISLISLIDADRQWIKSRVGIEIDETPRNIAFCNHTIQNDFLLEVNDAMEDERFKANPFVTDSPHVRFYAGHPLITPEGEKIGSLCVIDYQPHELDENQKEALKILAREVIANLEMNKKNQELSKLLIKAEEFQALFNSSHEIHCITDSDGNILFINDSVEQLLGYSVAECFGKNIWEFSVEGERERLMPAIYEDIAQGKNYFQIESKVLTKDGRMLWFEWSDVIKDGKWLINGRDITERKESEAKLKTLSLAVEKSAAGVFIRNCRNEIEWMNESAENIIDYKLSELQGKVFGNLLVGRQTNQAVIRYAQRAVSEGRAYEVENVLYKKDGTPVWLFISNTPLFDSAGKLERQVGVVVDITQRKQAEEQLIKTREEAIKLSKAKESFLSVMSHEMRTPLNAVVGMAKILKKEDPLERQIENLNILDFSANNLLNLINDVLDFSKIETGNLELEKTEVNIRSLAYQTIESLKFKTEGKDVQVCAQVDPAIPDSILGDSTRLYQIFINLLGNSVKFTEKGEIKLVLKLEEENEKSVKIKFEISDTGIGIPADKLETIFDVYTQAGSDTTRKFGGTGLGLSITKNLITLYQSQINIESEQGRGTTFYFSINFDKTSDKILQTVAEDEETPLDATILVVDDNAINRLLAGKILNRWSVKAEFAENGLEALEKINKNNYDLVLMDIHMPVMDGVEAVKLIRDINKPKYQKLPIIALTGSSQQGEEAGYLKAGMNDFVLKPFEPRILYNVIKSHLGSAWKEEASKTNDLHVHAT